jgi:hypothetical protein
LTYFTAHGDWASQHNNTIMCRVIPHIMCSFPAIMHQIHDTFPHSCNAFPCSCLVRVHHASSHFIVILRVSSCIFVFHRASLRFIAHLCVSSRIFAFHCASLHFIAHLHVSSRIFVFRCDLVRIITGASIHCPASPLVRRIPFITISNYVWHHMISISLWTLTLPHLHT